MNIKHLKGTQVIINNFLEEILYESIKYMKQNISDLGLFLMFGEYADSCD